MAGAVTRSNFFSRATEEKLGTGRNIFCYIFRLVQSEEKASHFEIKSVMLQLLHSTINPV